MFDRLLGSPGLTLVLAVFAAGLAGCSLQTPRGLMLQINRTYLDIREHIETGDYAALEADGARLVELVDRIRVLNEDTVYQEQADALAAIARRVEAAGRERDLADARTVFLELNRPCAECHRVYRVRSAVH